MSVDYCDRRGVALSSLLDTYGMESGEYHILLCAKCYSDFKSFMKGDTVIDTVKKVVNVQMSTDTYNSMMKNFDIPCDSEDRFNLQRLTFSHPITREEGV